MKSTYYILLFIFFTLVSCTKEGDVFDQEFDDRPNEATKTSLIVSLLNEQFITESVEVDTCFEINFPIKIATNNNQFITVENYAGITEAVDSQSDVFFIDSIVFPFNITDVDNDAITTIENVTQFREIFTTCEIPTLRDTLLRIIDTCYDFDYPINLTTPQQENHNFLNKSALIEFIEEQPVTYEPIFNFPITLLEEGESPQIIENYYQFYQVANDCETCDAIYIEVDPIREEDGIFNFILSSDSFITNEITWFINGELIEGKSEFIFLNIFEVSGTYTVCAKTKLDTCSEVQEVCVTLDLTIINCETLDFQTTLINTGPDSYEYDFKVNEPIASQLSSFSWEVDRILQPTTTNILNFTFTDTGLYRICVTIETPDCPEGFSSCDLIDVSP